MRHSGPPQEMILCFGRLYRERIGEQYPPTWGRDMKMFRELLEAYPQDKLTELLELYFEEDRRIYSIPFFKVELGNLLQEWVQRQEHKPRIIEDNESWRFE